MRSTAFLTPTAVEIDALLEKGKPTGFLERSINRPQIRVSHWPSPQTTRCYRGVCQGLFAFVRGEQRVGKATKGDIFNPSLFDRVVIKHSFW